MNQAKNFSFRGQVSQSIKAVFVILKLSIEVLAGNVKDIDEHLHVLEDIFSLRLEILLHEQILSTTVPQREDKIAQESDP